MSKYTYIRTVGTEYYTLSTEIIMEVMHDAHPSEAAVVVGTIGIFVFNGEPEMFSVHKCNSYFDKAFTWADLDDLLKQRLEADGK